MSTRITPSLQKNRKIHFWFFAFCIVLLSVYPVYKNFYNGKAVLSYERHVALMEGRSDFYNPWQYRMLAPLMIEGLMLVYDNTVNKIYPIEKLDFNYQQTSTPTDETQEFLKLLNDKRALKYTLVLVFFRVLLNVFVFMLAYRLWQYFIKNDWLIFLGLGFVSMAMGNAVIASDLTFNTYLDVIFYLLAAIIIVYKKDPKWLLLMVPVAALNRETSMLIPFLFFISQMDFSGFNIKKLNMGAIRFPAKNTWLLTAGLYVLFFVVFISLRMYYGYKPQQVWKVPAGLPMLKLNLFSAMSFKTYFEILGVFSILPFAILYKFRSMPQLLRVWFLGIVPLWLAVHFYSVVAYQTRLFMVPLVMIIMPMILWLVEKHMNTVDQRSSSVKQTNLAYSEMN
ncbi:MAG: hypothetical protein ACXWB9_08165 [Flavisolibacter sp.]